MKAEKYITRSTLESLEAQDFCVNSANPTKTSKKRENEKRQKVLLKCLNTEKWESLMLT